MTLTQEVKDLITKEFEEFKAEMYAGKTKEERSELGQFFTPPEISIRMIERFNCDSLAGKKILDPACGSGNLLAACLIAGADPDKVFGNDYDQVMVNACRARLQKLNPKVQNWQIHRGDATNPLHLEFNPERKDTNMSAGDLFSGLL
jgi:type I restriction-modification system DNA methylase subunit